MEHRFNIIAYYEEEWKLFYGCDSMEDVETCKNDLISRGINQDYILCYDNYLCKAIAI